MGSLSHNKKNIAAHKSVGQQSQWAPVDDYGRWIYRMDELRSATYIKTNTIITNCILYEQSFIPIEFREARWLYAVHYCAAKPWSPLIQTTTDRVNCRHFIVTQRQLYHKPQQTITKCEMCEYLLRCCDNDIISTPNITHMIKNLIIKNSLLFHGYFVMRRLISVIRLNDVLW